MYFKTIINRRYIKNKNWYLPKIDETPNDSRNEPDKHWIPPWKTNWFVWCIQTRGIKGSVHLEKHSTPNKKMFIIIKEPNLISQLIDCSLPKLINSSNQSDATKISMDEIYKKPLRKNKPSNIFLYNTINERWGIDLMDMSD